MRDRLIELIKNAKAREQADVLFGDIDYVIDMPSGDEYLANYLLANGVTVQEWISVKERLPDETKDEYVLVVCDYYGKITVETRKMWHIDSVVTHWMPLPQPPKGE